MPIAEAQVIVYDSEFAVMSTGQPFLVRWASWSPKESTSLLVCDRGRLLRFDGSRFMSTDTGVESNLRGIGYRPDGSEALIVGNEGKAFLYFDQKIKPINLGTNENLRRVSWRPDGEYALIIGNAGTCLRYDGSVTELNGAENNLRSVAWHPGGRYALVSGNRYRSGFAGMVADATIYRYEDGASELTSLFSESKGDLMSVDWRPDGTYALVVGYDLVWHQPLVYKYDGKACGELHFPEESVLLTGISWKPDGAYALLVSGGLKRGYGEGSVYRYSEGRFTRIYSIPEYLMAGISWRNDGSKAIIFGSRRAVTYTV